MLIMQDIATGHIYGKGHFQDGIFLGEGVILWLVLWHGGGL